MQYQMLPNESFTLVKNTPNNVYTVQHRLWDFWDYALVVLLVICIIGNTLTILVMRSKRMRHTNASLLLTSMAVADILVLTTKFLVQIQKIYKIPIYNFCMVTLIVPDIMALISYYLIIITTIERTIAVLYPLKVASMFSRKHCVLCILCLILFFMLIYTTKAVCLEYFPTQPAFCKIKGNTTQIYYHYYSFVFPWIKSALMSWIPSVLGIVFNSILIKGLYEASNSRKLISKQSSSKRINENLQLINTPISNSNNNVSNKQSHFTKERQITIMLCTVSVLFVSFTLPYATFELLRKLHVHQIFRNRELHRAVLLLLDCLHASNFILYCLTGQKFREQLKLLLLNVFKSSRKNFVFSSLKSKYTSSG